MGSNRGARHGEGPWGNDVWHWPIEELAATRDSLEKAKEADDLLRHQPENAALSAIRDGELDAAADAVARLATRVADLRRRLLG